MIVFSCTPKRRRFQHPVCGDREREVQWSAGRQRPHSHFPSITGRSQRDTPSGPVLQRSTFCITFSEISDWPPIFTSEHGIFWPLPGGAHRNDRTNFLCHLDDSGISVFRRAGIKIDSASQEVNLLNAQFARRFRSSPTISAVNRQQPSHPEPRFRCFRCPESHNFRLSKNLHECCPPKASGNWAHETPLVEWPRSRGRIQNEAELIRG